VLEQVREARSAPAIRPWIRRGTHKCGPHQRLERST
jgi:hypothetical protein